MGKFDFSSIESNVRMFILSVIGILIFVSIIAVSVFFVTVRGEEQTMVPDVVGKELTAALLELQVKELYPRLQLRFTQSSRDRGLILEQEPKPGTIVKAGRRVRLVVSQGVVLNKVENFISRNIDEVRMDIQTINASVGGIPLFTISEPLMYQFSAESHGTILAQKPEPGIDVSGPTTLEFVVSRGRENQSITVPQFTGLPLAETLRLITSSGINFQFSIVERRGNDRGEVIVSQDPPANTVIQANSVVQLTVSTPERLANNEIFALFKFTIPQNPFPLAVRLETVNSAGDRQRLFTVNYRGGEFTFPYKLPVGTELVLSMLDRELRREIVGN
jgi:beta-lactam-binding protein with PASTA domain